MLVFILVFSLVRKTCGGTPLREFFLVFDRPSQSSSCGYFAHFLLARFFFCKSFIFFYVFNLSYDALSHERLKSSTKVEDEISPLINIQILVILFIQFQLGVELAFGILEGGKIEGKKRGAKLKK